MDLKFEHPTFQKWETDLNRETDSEKQKAYIYDTLQHKTNLHIFGKYFFPHVIKGDYETPNCHLHLIEFLTNRDDGAAIFPRGFAKTTWEKIDTLHDVVYKLEPVILYISGTLQDAGFHFESIKIEFENNDRLRGVYGDLVPKDTFRESVKWTNTHFETTNGVNVVARGANKGRGVNIKNQRPTKAIVDDAENDEQVKSILRRRKYHEWLYNVIMPSLDKERGRIKLIGTIIHPEVEILKFYKAKGGIFRKAIEDEQSIWPEYWAHSDLMRVKDGYTKEDGTYVEGLGTRTFMQEYMNEPTNDELARIKAEWIDENVYTVLPTNREYILRKCIAIDPQSGESDGADEFAVTVLGWYTGDRHRYVLEQKAGQASQLEQAALLVRTWLEHPTAYVVGVEKVLSQVAVYQLVLEWRAGRLELPGVNGENRNIPLAAIGPQGSMASMAEKGSDKVSRFQIHEPMIERGELHIRPEMKKLREQILFLGTDVLDHDDCVDSLVFALDLSFKGDGNRGALTTGRQSTVGGNLMREKF